MARSKRRYLLLAIVYFKMILIGEGVLMRELSLHILDIAQNSIAADADLVRITIEENIDQDLLIITIADNGRGMDKKQQEKVVDPFVTSRETREVGLGIPFLKKAAQNCEGELKIDSTPGKGTEITANFEYSHIDRAPLGNISGTITTLITTNPTINFIYCHYIDNNKFEVRTKDIKNELENVAINNPQVVEWIEGYIKENLEELKSNR